MSWPKGKPRKGYKKKTSFKTIVNDAQKALSEESKINSPTEEQINKDINESVRNFFTTPRKNFIMDEDKSLWVGRVGYPPLQNEVVEVMECEGFYYAKTCSGKRFWIDTNTNSFKILDEKSQEQLCQSN